MARSELRALLLAEQARRKATDGDKAKAECRLIDFVRLMWGVVEPAHEFRSAWPLEAWCEHLEAVAAGQITRLLGNIPPGFTKSLTTNAFFPAWLWGPRRRPSERFLSASYAQHLPVRDNIRFRHIITSSLYRELWGDVFQPAPEQFSVVTVANDQRGWKLATSIGGVGTGERADFFLIDDPNNPLESESDAVMRTTNNWFREVVPDRLNDLERSAIIVIQQRTAENDVSGVILSEALDYIHMMVPMEYDPRRHCATPVWHDPRSDDGELAWPERFSRDVVERLKREKGGHAFHSQYQQSPEPRGGGIFKRDWWQLWPPDGEEFDSAGQPLVPLAFPAMECVVASLDTAYTTREENDWSAMTVWGAWRDTGARPLTAQERAEGRRPWKYGDVIGQPKLMLRGAWQKRLELHDLVEQVMKTCRKHKVNILLIEAAAAGHSVAQEIARLSLREEFGVKLVNPGGQDKVARAYAVQHLFEAGLVYAPDRAWADAVIAECAVFPHGKHDDLVDSAVQALRFLRDTGMALVLQEAEERVLEDYGPQGDPDADRLYDV